jgi:hypothetical protein
MEWLGGYGLEIFQFFEHFSTNINQQVPCFQVINKAHSMCFRPLLYTTLFVYLLISLVSYSEILMWCFIGTGNSLLKSGYCINLHQWFWHFDFGVPQWKKHLSVDSKYKSLNYYRKRIPFEKLVSKKYLHICACISRTYIFRSRIWK